MTDREEVALLSTPKLLTTALCTALRVWIRLRRGANPRSLAIVCDGKAIEIREGESWAFDQQELS